jgi:16S rRNA (adenine1518-N6/adenine1519-N6)-dimethyltransferase
MARQRLGQHFLVDAGWREKIARAIHASPHAIARSSTATGEAGFCWIEIGAGHGEMTEILAAGGMPVYAIELDTRLVEGLRRLALKHSNLTIVAGDVLKADLGAIAAGRRARVYGNLPYYITSPILHHLFSFANLIDDIHMVIQNEVAQRLVAKPDTKLYGYLSVVTQLYTRPDLVFTIPRGAFRPPPEVGSALVTLRLPGERADLGIGDEANFLKFVKLCFAQKRKTLVNNLRPVASPEVVRETLAELKLRPDSRSEQLSVACLTALHARLSANR